MFREAGINGRLPRYSGSTTRHFLPYPARNGTVFERRTAAAAGTLYTGERTPEKLKFLRSSIAVGALRQTLHVCVSRDAQSKPYVQSGQTRPETSNVMEIVSTRTNSSGWETQQEKGRNK